MSQKYLPSTSRDLNPTNYAWDSIVYQAGRPMLDSELNLTQDILNKKNTLPSGMISYQGEDDSIGSFAYEKPYVAGVLNGNFTANTLTINPFKAMVNGIVIDVRNTNANDGTNKVTLPSPDAGSGAGNRGDFVFLEVWRKDVTPAMQSKSRIKLIDPQATDTFTFSKGGVSVILTVDTTFAIGASLAHTARNMAQAINDYDGAGLGLTVDGVTTFAETRGTEFVFLNHNGGASGNYTGGASFTLASSDVTGIQIQIQPSGGSDGDGKPSANKVYYAGNVLSDSSTHLDDNIQDPNVNVSSTRRIQVQYRIRTQQNTNLSDFIFGFENGTLNAQGSQGSFVAGKSFSRHTTDTGLWYAGDGSEADATALGTVDGYVYAIPLCYVFRRQSPGVGGAGFNAIGSFNTGALHDHDGTTLASNDYVDNVAIRESDRPDGLFADEVAQSDVLDLRRRVYPRGIDFSAELEYQYHTLLDNENRTWFAKAHNLQDTGNGSGGASTTPLVCDVYGRNEPVNIGGAGEHRRTFDHIARRWSDTPTTERIYIVAKPTNTVTQPSTGVSVVGAGFGDYWYEGDVIKIDLTSLKVSSHLLWADNGSQTFEFWGGGDFAPKLLDIGFCWHNDGHYTTAIEQQVKISSVDGLGTNEINITLEENPITANGGILAGADYKLVGDAINGESTGSNGEIFIELIFDYASFNRGLSGVAIDVPTPDPSGYPTGSAVLIESAPTNAYDPYPGKGNGNAPPISNVIPQTKQVSLEYVYAQQSIEIVSNTNLSAYLPWRLYYRSGLAPGITDSSGGLTICTLDNTTTKYQHAESKIGWNNSVNGWVAGQRKLTISAFPIEPYPADSVTDSTLLVYYNRSAPMTVGSDKATNVPGVGVNAGGVVPDELNLQPLAVGKEVSVFLKTNDHYPFFNPTDQLGTHPNASADFKEYETLSNSDVFLDDLKINTGSVNLPSFVPFVSSVNITLGDTSPSQPPVKDDYSRVVYPTMEDSSYFPSSFAKNMSGYHSGYKTTIPCLMKIVDDSHTLYRKGEVVLVVFVKTNTWGQGASVDMRSTLVDNYVVACVYRTKNQLLLGE